MEKKRFKIIQLIAGLDIGDSQGGAERFGLELSRNLDREVYDVLICAFWRRNSLAESHWLDILRKSGMRVSFASEWRGKFHPIAYIRGVIAVARLAKMNKTHLIHSHFQWGTFSAVCARVLGYTKTAMRTAHISREWGTDLLAWIMRRIFTDWIFPLFLNLEIGVSQHIVDGLQRNPGSKIRGRQPELIHNAINIKIIKDQGEKPLPNQYSMQEDNLVIGTAGRLEKQKGVHFLLEAFPRIFRELPNVQLIILGSGSLRSELEGLTHRLAISHRVTFLGQVENPYPHFRSMDIFVLPSLWEGLPTVLLECMAFQVPLIATDVPGTNELLKDRVNGLLVPSKDSDSIANAVLEITSDTELREKLVENASNSLKRYTIDRIASQYEETYFEILGNH